MKRMSHKCSLIIPTRNRRSVLARTLARIAALPDRDFEVIVCDNGSTDAATDMEGEFSRFRWIWLDANLGAAARNIGAAAATAPLLIMLDDDSWPAPGTVDHIVKFFDDRHELGAAGMRVRLAAPPHHHDTGGVRGIFFNCGGAIRRDAFLHAGGISIDFDYYVEEYDLCARLIRHGWHVEPCSDAAIWHERVGVNRDNNRMLRLLVRNNLRFWQRYAPTQRRDDLIASTLERYHRIAIKEKAFAGYLAGLEAGRAILADHSGHTPLTMEQFERLMGIDVARQTLRGWADKHRVKKVAVWARAKGCESLLELLREATIGVEAVYDDFNNADSWRGHDLKSFEEFQPEGVDGVVIGCLSCGVAEDLQGDVRRRFPGAAILNPAPWQLAEQQKWALSA